MPKRKVNMDPTDPKTFGREIIHCDQCVMLSINGVGCHETGCPNQGKVWRRGEWMQLYKCVECGGKFEDREDAAGCCAAFEEAS